MNLKEQQYVCTLARCRNLSRAAEALFNAVKAEYAENKKKYQ